jgi:hypothetical protein
MKTEFKSFVGEVKSWDDSELVIEHFISTEVQDSGGDIMLADGMKMRGKPVVLFQHGLDPKFGSEPIAKVLDIRVGEFNGKRGLIARTKYFDGSHLTPPDNTGRRLYEKAKDGTMPNWSIGFNAIREHPTNGGRIVDEWELHEYSQVAVGMNSEATTLSASAPEIKFLIHDDGSPEGFDDIKAFMNATVEITDLGDVDELVCKNDECRLVKNGDMKPYANEHACRLREPSEFIKFRRQNGAREHEGKKYDVIYGQLKGSDKWAEQAIRYPNDAWSVKQASEHCKARDGWFEAAKSVSPETGETKSAASFQRSHKAIRTLHCAMLTDLKMHGEREDLLDAGAEKCAKEAIEEFGDNATPHVVKYIKCVRDMKEDELFGDEDDADARDTEPEIEEKSYTKAHRALQKCLTDTVKAIRAYKCNKAAVPEAEAEKVITEHAASATPHAIEYIKTWHEKCRAAENEPEREMKPTPETPALSDPADDEQPLKFFIRQPPEQIVRVVTPPTPPAQVLTVKTGETERPKVPAEIVKELLASIPAAMEKIVRDELKRASGKVT